MNKKLLFVVNAPEYMISHRLPIALAAKEIGYDVHIATPDAGQVVSSHKDPVDFLKRKGFVCHPINLQRGGYKILQEFKSLMQLIFLFWKLKPDVVHLVTIKPCLYGGLAARLTSVRSVVMAIAGLGSAQSVDKLGRLKFYLVSTLFKLSFNQRRIKVIFQNKFDFESVLKSVGLDVDRAVVIPGSGIDLKEYAVLTEPKGVAVITFAARLLRSKGVLDFYQAAKILDERGVAFKFNLAGAPDLGNPDSITEEELQLLASNSSINVLGYCDDIAKLYSSSNIVCLPSYYGEGLPKSLIEAAGCGRAIITTNMPGCKDAVLDGVTGILVEPKNPMALADAIQYLIDNPKVRINMGKKARDFAEETFSIDSVVKAHVEIYETLYSTK